MQQYIKRNRFDFEIGYLTQSPCLKCERREETPKCQSTCKLIDKIKILLSGGISCQASSYDA